MNEYTEPFENASKIWLSIITSVVSIIAFWEIFNNLLAIPFGILIFVICFFMKSIELIRPKYFEEAREINKVLTKYLENTNESIYYFGGAGLIGASDDWKKKLAKKLEDPRVKIVRLIDLKKPNELEPLLKKMYCKEVGSQIDEYRKWIVTHAKYLKGEDSMNKSNFFYDYEGAPIWKHGTSYIVFDEKISVIITPGVQIEGNEVVTGRKVIIIRSHEIAKELKGSIDSVVTQFDLKNLSKEDLETVCRDENE